MAESYDKALLLRSIPYGETSLIIHVLTEKEGRLALMARGVKRAKSPFRAALAPMYDLQLSWRQGRTGMGTLLEAQRNESLLAEAQHIEGQEILALAAKIYHEGDGVGYAECKKAFACLRQRDDEVGLLAASWQMLIETGWLGDMQQCWHCGEAVEVQAMYWQHGQLICQGCGSGMLVSAGLRKSIMACQDISLSHIQLSVVHQQQWRQMIKDVLRVHRM